MILSAPVWKSKTGQDRIHQALQNGRSPGGRPVINLGQFLSRVCKFDDFLICRAVEAEQNIGERHEGEQGEQNNHEQKDHTQLDKLRQKRLGGLGSRAVHPSIGGAAGNIRGRCGDTNTLSS